MTEMKTPEKNIILIPCSGSEYNGELARKIALNLDVNDSISNFSEFFCSTFFLRNYLLKKENLFEMTKQRLFSNYIIVIDGCRTSCMVQILKALDIKPDLVINLQQFVPKPDLDLNDPNAFQKIPKANDVNHEEVEKISNYILDKLREKNFNGLNLKE